MSNSEFQNAFFDTKRGGFIITKTERLKSVLIGRIIKSKRCYMSEDYFTNMTTDNSDKIFVYKLHNKKEVASFLNLYKFKESKKRKSWNLVFNQVVFFQALSSETVFRLFIPYPYCTIFWQENSEERLMKSYCLLKKSHHHF